MCKFKAKLGKSIFYFVSILIITLCLQLQIVNLKANGMAYSSTVYLGGTPLGLVAKIDGLMVSDYLDVITESGKVNPSKAAGLQIGDIILSIDGGKVDGIEDLKRLVEKAENGINTVKVKRGTEVFETTVQPQMDIIAGVKKLGICVKNELAGVGTLTYVNPANKRFGGLGHQIHDKSSHNNFYKGNIYKCNVIGVVKGECGKAGELRGIFNRAEVPIATMDKNLFCGIFGQAYPDMIEDKPLISLGERKTVKMGKAFIYTSVNGNKPKKYEIEIVKAVNQNNPAEKSMVIHVTDKELLEKTGGIVQGMSGSPIIQNDKLIGAVTHVFLNDPTRGYGIYIDWMINN